MAEIVDNTAKITTRSRRPSAFLSFIGRLFREKPLGAIGFVICMIFLFAGIFADLIAPYGFNQIMPINRMKPPSERFWFGTDNLGRDIFSRVLFGARLDLTAGFVMTFVPMIYGVLIGAYAGYRGGWVDTVIAGITNVAIAFPFLVMIIVVVAVIGPGLTSIYVSVFLLAWTMYARLARADMMVERAKDYMLAARVLGYPTAKIVLRHGLPNAIASSIVFSMSDFILNILLLSGLSFIGLGIQPPQSEWGSMTAEGAQYIVTGEWWLFLFPGLAIVVMVLAFNLVGDGLRDFLDPRMRGVR